MSEWKRLSCIVVAAFKSFHPGFSSRMHPMGSWEQETPLTQYQPSKWVQCFGDLYLCNQNSSNRNWQSETVGLGKTIKLAIDQRIGVRPTPLLRMRRRPGRLSVTSRLYYTNEISNHIWRCSQLKRHLADDHRTGLLHGDVGNVTRCVTCYSGYNTVGENYGTKMLSTCLLSALYSAWRVQRILDYRINLNKWKHRFGAASAVHSVKRVKSVVKLSSLSSGAWDYRLNESQTTQLPGWHKLVETWRVIGVTALQPQCVGLFGNCFSAVFVWFYTEVEYVDAGMKVCRWILDQEFHLYIWNIVFFLDNGWENILRISWLRLLFNSRGKIL